ncbi:hypothetical protein ABPG74_001343 [Tetrahymena malaccensis]
MINFFKVIGFLFLIHAGYSLMKYRKYLTFNDRADEFSIPLDILAEIIFGLVLNLFFGILLDGKFQDIYQFDSKTGYDASFSRPTFKSVKSTRGAVFKQFLQKKLGDFDLGK